MCGNFRNQTTGREVVVLVMACLLTTTSISMAHIPVNTISINEALTYSFTFIEPSFQTIATGNYGYTTVHMSGCIAVGKQDGDPMIPVKSVKLLLPAMTIVTSVNVIGTPIEIELNVDLKEKPVFPYQRPVPFGFEPEDFKFNTALYASDLLYPFDIHRGYHIGYCRGYAILDITLNPVQYIPGEGKIFYYPELTVTLTLKNTGDVNQFFRNNQDDRTWVERLVYNPEIADTYTIDLPTFDYPGGLCDPSDDYDYVIITTTKNGLDYWPTGGSTPYNWESLMDRHEIDDGLSCTLVTIQDIDACPDYHNPDPLFNDLEAYIREFCKDAYQDWDTSYIFVGGDDEWIPARHMKYSYEANVDSDIYWSNLDNSFNADHDIYWGEEGDSGFDLYSELFIGRITCDMPQDVSNWMTKSFYYADSDDMEYLDNAAFYGGDTEWSCQGDDFIDYSAIKGTDNWLGPVPGAHGKYPTWLGFQYGFETWNEVSPGNEYNLSVKWTAEPPNPGWQGGSESAAVAGLKNAINNDQVTLISGIAHAYEGMSLDVVMSSWESNYHNTKPFFIHDYGCHCGDMDAADDGVLHSMLFHSDTELAFGCVYNTCYGWGSFEDTNSSSALQQKLFWDYLFDVANNSGSTMNWQLGKAMAYSKDMMAPTIRWTYSSAPGSWRGVIQGCLLFGDPAQRIKTMAGRPPETPERPAGPTEVIGEVMYPFTTHTTDPDGDDVYYLFDWDDGTDSGWLGPYNSGDTAEASHAWTNEGIYDVRVKAKDVNGAESGWSDPLTLHNNLPPYAPSNPMPSNGSTDVSINASLSWNGGDPDSGPLTYALQKLGTSDLDLEGILIADVTGVEIPADVFDGSVTVVEQGDDTTPPVTNCTLDPIEPDGDNGWYVSVVTVTLVATDEGSGVESTWYRLNGGYWKFYYQPFEVSGEGEHTLEYRSFDRARNKEDTKKVEFKIDTKSPVTIHEFDGVIGKDGWFVGNVTVTLSATDATSGVNYTKYKLDDGTWMNYTNPFDVTENGEYTLYYYSVDLAGNTEPTNEVDFKIKHDTTPPNTTHNFSGIMGDNGWYIYNVVVTLTAEDDSAGVDYTMYKVDDGEWILYVDSFVITKDGEHTLYYYSVDLVGNIESTNEADFKMVHTTYDVYFGTVSPPPKVVSNQSETTYDPGTMDYGTKYYWQIVAWDSYGLSTEGPIWEFITIEPPVINSVSMITSDPLDTIIGWEKITCTVTDNFAVDEIKLVVTYPDSSTIEYPMIKNGDTYSCNTTLTDAGDYTYHVWADDFGGNITTSTPETFVLPPNYEVDMDGMRTIGFWDIMAVAGEYGNAGSNGWVREDVDNDGAVGFWDIMAVAGHYGESW